MYDYFKPGLHIPMYPFKFYAKRYEVWQKGKMILSGEMVIPIVFGVKENATGIQTMESIILDGRLTEQLAQIVSFDAFISNGGRLMLLTIPLKTNAYCEGIEMMSLTIITREEKNFQANEPYCCSLFYEHGELVKVTYSFSNPKKLMEFYK